eukprot:CAMPEP_0172489724 /NCGR_PEP_ID=MMETSP1066-20121228/19932_1 /TAXON_ID=671091 /ORGANISM="Coscinodiscus wailesii, Strain CCMP2513" /LENGTH=416 /DNA_ID=CAMNT_0013257801 /DNA_START=83 /DNA_END=1333 /DNA_ORIENTATION=-
MTKDTLQEVAVTDVTDKHLPLVEKSEKIETLPDDEAEQPKEPVTENNSKPEEDSHATLPRATATNGTDDHLSVADKSESAVRSQSSSPQQHAAKLYADDRHLEAARILRKLQSDKSEKLTPESLSILQKASEMESFLDTIKSPPPSDWKRHSQKYRNGIPTNIFNKVTPDGTLHIKVQTPIAQSLLKPLLSVLNETELYSTFIPRWTVPVKLGVARSIKISQVSRVSQILIVTMDMPWPLPKREVVLKAIAMDDIDTEGDIVVTIDTLHTGDEGGLVPPPEENVVRSDAHGGFLFRKCPKEFISYDSKGEPKTVNLEGGDCGEKLILASFVVTYKAGGAEMIPKRLIEFVVRVAIGRIWAKFLNVAEEVRNGTREAHCRVIEEKKEVLYDWVDGRVSVMINRGEDETTTHVAADGV